MQLSELYATLAALQQQPRGLAGGLSDDTWEDPRGQATTGIPLLDEILRYGANSAAEKFLAPAPTPTPTPVPTNEYGRTPMQQDMVDAGNALLDVAGRAFYNFMTEGSRPQRNGLIQDVFGPYTPPFLVSQEQLAKQQAVTNPDATMLDPVAAVAQAGDAPVASPQEGPTSQPGDPLPPEVAGFTPAATAQQNPFPQAATDPSQLETPTPSEKKANAQARAAAAAEEGKKEAPKASGKTHVVVWGDNLWDIAAQELGDPWRWQEIYELNKDQIKNPRLIYPGQKLKLPGGKTKGSDQVKAEQPAAGQAVPDQGQSPAGQAAASQTQPAQTGEGDGAPEDPAAAEGIVDSVDAELGPLAPKDVSVNPDGTPNPGGEPNFSQAPGMTPAQAENPVNAPAAAKAATTSQEQATYIARIPEGAYVSVTLPDGTKKNVLARDIAQKAFAGKKVTSKGQAVLDFTNYSPEQRTQYVESLIQTVGGAPSPDGDLDLDSYVPGAAQSVQVGGQTLQAGTLPGATPTPMAGLYGQAMAAGQQVQTNQQLDAFLAQYAGATPQQLATWTPTMKQAIYSEVMARLQSLQGNGLFAPSNLQGNSGLISPSSSPAAFGN